MFVQVGSTILLARLLSPHDYGLVAMVFALLAFAPMLVDMGTSEACVQKTRVTPAEVSALFWLNVAIGGILTIVVASCSKLIALFYGEPELTSIALVSSLTLLAGALSTQHYALMRRAMRFQRIAMIDVSSNVISSIVAIVMALTGWGYWALVARPILAAGLSAVGVWLHCPWLPERPRLNSDAKELVGFGMNVTGFTMTDYVARSADRISLGYIYGAGSLGYYHNAFLLYDNMLALLAYPLHGVAVASLSKLRDSVDELRRSWAAALSMLSFVASLGFAVLAVTGQDFVVILLGQKWAPAGPLICIFAVRGIAHVIERTLGWLHVAAGRSDRWMRWGLLSAVVQLAAVLAGLPFGPVGVAAAHTVATFCLFVPALAYSGQPLGIGAKDVLRAVGPQTVAALATVAFGYTVQNLFFLDFSELTRLVCSALVCLVTLVRDLRQRPLRRSP
jgi:PST family polysaccharide transporter